jgi:uncharacterized protein (TIGR03067 family)
MFSALVLVCCNKTSTDSGDDLLHTELDGVWSTTEISSNYAEIVINWTFTDEDIAINYVGLQNMPGTYTIDSTASPKHLDMDFDEYTPFHHDPVLAIYKTIGQDSLVISVANETSARPTNFNRTEYNYYYIFELSRIE